MSRSFGIVLLLALAGICPAAAQTESLGRLFYTPEQRAGIEAARRSAGESSGPAAETVIVAADPVPRLRLDGLVHRDAGPSVAFLNHRPIEDGGAILDYRVVTGPQGVTLLGPDGQRVRLLVGQTLIRAEGRIVDPLPPHSLSSPR